MTRTALFVDPGHTVLMAVAGVALGLAYFASLKRSVASFVSGGRWPRSLAEMAARIGVAAAVLLVAAKLGAVPLLALFGGFLLARTLTLRAERRRR